MHGPKAMHSPKEIGLIVVGYGEADGQKGLYFKGDTCCCGGGFHWRNLGSVLGDSTLKTECGNEAICAVMALYA